MEYCFEVLGGESKRVCMAGGGVRYRHISPNRLARGPGEKRGVTTFKKPHGQKGTRVALNPEFPFQI